MAKANRKPTDTQHQNLAQELTVSLQMAMNRLRLRKTLHKCEYRSWDVEITQKDENDRRERDTMCIVQLTIGNQECYRLPKPK